MKLFALIAGTIVALLASLNVDAADLIISGFSKHFGAQIIEQRIQYYVLDADGNKVFGDVETKHVHRPWNERNLGLGLQHDLTKHINIHGGAYHDSRGEVSSYVGSSYLWQLFNAHKVELEGGLTFDIHYRPVEGLLAGPLPVAAIKYRGYGMNVLYIPKVPFIKQRTVHTAYVQFVVPISL